MRAIALLTGDCVSITPICRLVSYYVLIRRRKPCLPSAPLLARDPARWVTGDTAYEALSSVPGGSGCLRALWPVGQGPEQGDVVDRIVDLADLRNWHTGLHGGSRRVVEGWITPAVG